MRRTRILLAGLAIGTTIAVASPAAASPSCVGQLLLASAPVFGADLGAQIAFEARNPEAIGAPNLGAAVAEFAGADREACPAE